MIVRIMGEGQREIDDAQVEELNTLDDELQSAVESGDAAVFRDALGALLDRVRAMGDAVPMDSLDPSDLLLPPPDATLDDVREMLGDEGLIPG